MSVSVVVYALGSVVELWLATMLVLVCQASLDEQRRWSGLLAAGLAINGARLALLANGIGNVPLSGPLNPWTGLLSYFALGFLTSGLIDYVGISGTLRRRLNSAAVTVLVLTAVAVMLHMISRGDGWLIGAGFGVGWVALFLEAWHRQRLRAHALAIIALSTFPCVVVAIRFGAIPLDLLPAAEIVPLSLIGITVLTTGLIRAASRAGHEALRAGQALARSEAAEAALQESNRTLEQRVGTRTAELRETIEGLESFNRSVSHDLQGPLGGIVGVARIAREHIAAGNEAEADRMLAAIGRQGANSVALINALLALARAGNAELRRSSVDSSAIAKESAESLRELRPAMPRVNLLPMPVVDADPELLRQVFTNLISNASKFAADADPPHIEVGHAKTLKGDAFFVRDNGIGFSAVQARQLFKPFNRLHGSHYEGFGVGLSIVRRIIDHHGGQIWADGAPGGGATFWFTLSS